VAKTLADGAAQAEHSVPETVARRRAVAETRAVLEKASAAWAPYSCPGTAECCQLAVTKRPPYLWPSEWAALVEELKRQGRAMPPTRADGACVFLDEAGKRCTVYAARPFGCRTFFCHRIQGPARQPADATNALLERLKALNLEWDDAAEVKSLPEWVASGAVSRR
jgi:Fe-S-cluster containining protein